MVLTLILVTRAASQIRSTYRGSNPDSNTRAISRLPHWVPYFGNTPIFFLRSQSWLLGESRACQSGIFALHLSSRDYLVVTSPDLQARLTDPATPVTTNQHDELRSRRFFGNRQVTGIATKRISKAVLAYTTDESRIIKLTRLLESQAYNFISPSESWVDQAQWERTADVTVISGKPTLSVSASLPTLIRDFSSYVMVSTILGTSFVDTNPGFIGDFFIFSYKYATFMTGLPYWVAPGLGPPALARERCLLILDGLVDAIIADLDGKSMQGMGTGMLYDLEDVHPAIWDLIRQARSEGAKENIRTISSELLEIIWHMTFSSANMVIWLVLYLSMDGDSNKMALQSINEELKSVVKVVKPEPTGLPIEDAPRLQFSAAVSGKLNNCLTLRAALLEIQRLETEAEEYLTVTDDFILQSDETGSGSEKFQLKTGDHIYAAYGATNKDTKFWDRPKRFAPSRYILKEDDDKKETVNNKLPKTRGEHHSVLRVDVLCIVAALLAFYEIGSLDDGGLKHPSSKIVAGVGVPKEFKCKISRRLVAR